MDRYNNSPSQIFAKNTGCTAVSKQAQANPFLNYGKFVNLTNINPGVKWSIVDPNGYLASSKP